MTRWLIGAWLGAALGIAACVPNEMPQASDGHGLFMEYCSACHGADAKGHGPIAEGLSPPPKDLTLIAKRRGGDFPRAEILSVIDGYARSESSGPGMPEFGELLEGDLVPLDTGDGTMTPTPRKLVALLEYLESIQQAR